MKGGHHPRPGTTRQQGIIRGGTVSTPEGQAPVATRTNVRTGATRVTVETIAFPRATRTRTKTRTMLRGPSMKKKKKEKKRKEKPRKNHQRYRRRFACSAEGSRQLEKQLDLHVQEKFGSEQQSVRLETENGGSIGSSGRGVRDVREPVGHGGEGVRWCRHVVCFRAGRG